MRLTIKKLPFDTKEYVESSNGEIVEVRYNWNFVGTTIYYSLQKLLNKLGQLEDIEDELGIDLITLFKALKNGIYGKVGKKIENILAPHLSWYNQEIYIFKIKDYGKSWALTKEELK